MEMQSPTAEVKDKQVETKMGPLEMSATFHAAIGTSFVTGHYFVDKLKGKGLEQSAIQQARERIEVLEQTRRLFLKVAVAEAEYARLLDKIISEELESHKSVGQSAALYGSAAESFSNAIKDIAAQSTAHRIFSTQLTETLCEDMEEDMHNMHTELKELEEKDGALQHRLEALKKNVANNKAKTAKYLETANQLSGGKKGMKIMSKRQANPEIARKLESYVNAYDKGLKTSNEFIDQLARFYSPLFLTQIQDFEQRRIQTFKQRLLNYSDMRKSLISKENQIFVAEDAATIAVDPEKDIKLFADHLIVDPTLKRRNHKPLSYELPEPMDVIRKKATSLEASHPKKSSTPSLRKSFMEKMDWKKGDSGGSGKNLNVPGSQKSPKNDGPAFVQIPKFPPRIDSDMSFKIPRVFSCLKRAVFDMGGVYTEGIFRINGDVKEIQEMMTHIVEEDDCEIKPSTIHCAAGLLKKYLRDFYEPLLAPVDNAVIEEVSKELSSEDSKEVENAQTRLLLDIFAKVNPKNQMIIMGLIILIRDISNNEAKTKMGIEGLATVFGPIFVSSAMEMDPMRIMNLSKCGGLILQTLVKILDTSGYPEEEEELTKSSLIDPKKISISN
jgi:hypothetical protein